MHGNLSQNQRERALSQFETGRVSALVATDVAARGLDLDDITHVINFDPPRVPDELPAPPPAPQVDTRAREPRATSRT